MADGEKTLTEISKLLSSHLTALEPYSVQLNDITISKFTARKDAISANEKNYANLMREVKKYKEKIEKMKEIQNKETSHLKTIIDEEPPVQKASWAVVAAKDNAPKPQVGRQIRTRQSVAISGSLNLDAVVVPWFTDVVEDGQLYYVEKCNHFALIINGLLLHGNIGDIICDDAQKLRTLDCKYNNGCTHESCDFYHDPLIFPKSKDVRNYHISQFLYRPGTERRKNGRYFGSLEHMDSDVLLESSTNISMYKDMAMHHLLCALIAVKYIN